MYFDPVYTDLTQFIGYAGKPLAEAQQFIRQLEEKYGRQRVIEASEALSASEGKQEHMAVRLTAEARRLAWQLLGPPKDHVSTGNPVAIAMKTGERLRADSNPPQKSPKPRSKKIPSPAPKASGVDSMIGDGKDDQQGASVLGTPMLQQYREAKERHPGMLLLFRVGDFYELYDDDAHVAAKLLGLTLTTRDRVLSMSGFPHHSLEVYLRKLLHAGKRVAVCDQVETSMPKQSNPCEVTRVVIPSQAAQEDSAKPKISTSVLADEATNRPHSAAPTVPSPSHVSPTRKPSRPKRRRGTTGS